MKPLSEFSLKGAYNSYLVSKDYNDRIYEIYGKNVIIEGFVVTAASGNTVSVSSGKAVVEGVLVEPKETTPASKVITIPTNTTVPAGIVHYIYIEYSHIVNVDGNSDSVVEIKASQIKPPSNRNTIILAEINRRHNVSAVSPSDIKPLESKRITLSDILRIEKNSNKSLFEASEISFLKTHRYSVNCSGKTTADVPLVSFNKDMDTMLLFLNSSLMIKGKDYSLSQAAGKVAKITFTYSQLGEIDFLIIKNLIPSTNQISAKLTEAGIGACVSYEITSPSFTAGAVSYEIPVLFDKNKDFLMVSANSVIYSLNTEYSLSTNSGKNFINFTRPRETSETIDIVIFKNIYTGSIITSSDGTVDQDIKAFIESNGDRPWTKKVDITISSSNRTNLTVPDLSYNLLKDEMLLFVNSVVLLEGKDYIVKQEASSSAVISFSPPLAVGQKLEMLMLKNVRPSDSKITEYKIAESAIVNGLKQQLQDLSNELANVRNKAVFW